jgi:hypothetical protein
MIHQLPQQSIEVARNQLLNYSNLNSLCFVSSFVTGSELSFYLLKEINSHIEKFPYYEVCLYALNKELPVLHAQCAIFSSIELSSCNKVLFALDVPSWQASLISPSQHKYLILYDVKMLEKISPELINKINESRYVVITRSKKYADFLKKMGFTNIIDKYLPEFSLDSIRKDILNESI